MSPLVVSGPCLDDLGKRCHFHRRKLLIHCNHHLTPLLTWRMFRWLGVAAVGDTRCCTLTWPPGDCLRRLASKEAGARNIGACCVWLLHLKQSPLKQAEVSVYLSGRPRHKLPSRCPGAPITSALACNATSPLQAHIDYASSSLLEYQSQFRSRARASWYSVHARVFSNLL